MQWNPGNGLGIVDEINDICHSDDNNFPPESKTRRGNGALDEFLKIAFKADGRFSFDDSNYSEKPLFTQTLTSGVRKYDIADFADAASDNFEILNFLRFEVVDSTGNSKVLNRLNRNDVTIGLTEYQPTNGIPREYDLLGRWLEVFPTPNYTRAAALRAYADRAQTRIAVDDTTFEPGIPSIFHLYIARKASIPFLAEEQKSQLTSIQNLVLIDEENIRRFYQRREKGVPNRLIPVVESTE